MNRQKITIASVVLLLASPFIQAQEAPAQLVSVENAKVEKVQPTMWLPGNVVSRRNAPISAEQTGQLLWIEDIGAQVTQGQVIAKIDGRHLELQLARQQAQVTQKQADVEYLTKQKARLTALKQQKNASVSELERVIKDLTVAKSEVQALEILVEQTKLSLSKTKIKAPFSGNISDRFAHVGELIAIGRPLLQLVDTQHLDIQIAAPIAISHYIQSDAKAMVKWQDKLLELPVRSWGRAGDQSSRTFNVLLAADGISLIAGTPVTVSLPKGNASNATLVPRDALYLRERETFVLTVDKEDNAKKVPVLVGQGMGQWISISGDVWAGDEVIVRGGERIQDGQKVRKDLKLVAKI